jgi:hypothetical protein
MSLFSLNVDILSLSDSHAERWPCSLLAPGGLCTQWLPLIMAKWED